MGGAPGALGADRRIRAAMEVLLALQASMRGGLQQQESQNRRRVRDGGENAIRTGGSDLFSRESNIITYGFRLAFSLTYATPSSSRTRRR